MQRSYKAIDGQSNIDIVLQTYGTIDNLLKLIQDSGVDNVNVKPRSQQAFTYDDELIINQGIQNQFLLSGIIYATNSGINGETYYVIKQKSTPKVIKGPDILPPPPNTEDMYSETNGTSFVSGADGTTTFTPMDKDGNSMIGVDIVQVELEIKPLTNVQWVWNKVLGTMSLIGVTLDAGQTAAIIYRKLITP